MSARVSTGKNILKVGYTYGKPEEWIFVLRLHQPTVYQLNELAELYNCNNVMFFEARKGKDLYVWMSKAPNGPTVKMHLQNCMLPDIICETSHGS